LPDPRKPGSNAPDMRERPSCGYFSALLLVMIFLAAYPAGGNENGDLLTFSGALVSGDLRDTPLKVVLKEIKQKKGLRFYGEEKVGDASISLSFQALSLSAALGRLLAHFNYSFIYDRGNHLVGVFIAGKTGHPSSVRRRPEQFHRPGSSRSSPISK